MTTRFQQKNPLGGRLTPSNLSSTSTVAATSTTSSPSTHSNAADSDQTYLGNEDLMEKLHYFI